jgi:hypothetical protein
MITRAFDILVPPPARMGVQFIFRRMARQQQTMRDEIQEKSPIPPVEMGA